MYFDCWRRGLLLSVSSRKPSVAIFLLVSPRPLFARLLKSFPPSCQTLQAGLILPGHSRAVRPVAEKFPSYQTLQAYRSKREPSPGVYKQPGTGPFNNQLDGAVARRLEIHLKLAPTGLEFDFSMLPEVFRYSTYRRTDDGTDDGTD